MIHSTHNGRQHDIYFCSQKFKNCLNSLISRASAKSRDVKFIPYSVAFWQVKRHATWMSIKW